ncbi:hypothetical protein PPERSA_07210 [Pseudocohnilembus persalinus]|uniref:Uncharacterized protein n=1 Tax=Pseudocohnilembus persalinus TaxID=266149 RepID=A0A0V0QD23_PSEPJ|nr:hypothetical protein PPERSA_07210 [Pseudocohnilembus persalinus]|eukprot:KRX00103.1 hypothetical protein PPERSA_07210 [Pseudocohnilembus persalinus]
MDNKENRSKKKRINPQKIDPDELENPSSLNLIDKKIRSQIGESIKVSELEAKKQKEEPYKQITELKNWLQSQNTPESEQKLEEARKEIEELQILIEDKLENLFVSKCTQKFPKLTADEFLTLFEENMLVENEQEIKQTLAKNPKNDQKKNDEKNNNINTIIQINKTITYVNKLLHQDSYFELQTVNIYNKQNTKNKQAKGSKSKQQKKIVDEDDEVIISSSAKLIYFDKKGNEQVVTEIQETEEEPEDYNIKEDFINNLINKEMRFDISQNKKIDKDIIVQGLVEYFSDRINENILIDEPEEFNDQHEKQGK